MNEEMIKMLIELERVIGATEKAKQAKNEEENKSDLKFINKINCNDVLDAVYRKALAEEITAEMEYIEAKNKTERISNIISLSKTLYDMNELVEKLSKDNGLSEKDILKRIDSVDEAINDDSFLIKLKNK